MQVLMKVADGKHYEEALLFLLLGKNAMMSAAVHSCTFKKHHEN